MTARTVDRSRPVSVLLVRAGFVLLAALLALLAWSGGNFVADAFALARFPYQVDFGEGIAWEHARLMLTPGAYSPSMTVPFIAIEYPPVYYLVTRAVAGLGPDLLASGRLVSLAASLGGAGLIAALVLRLTRRRPDGLRHAAAAVAGLLFLSMHATRHWGDLFRVDMLAVTLGLLGTWVALRADGRFWGTLGGLLLCVAAVYTKQSALPAFLSVGVVAILRRPRPGLGAVVTAGVVAAVALLALEALTGGGFLRNTVSYLVNVMTWNKAWHVLLAERTSFPFALVMVAAALWSVASLPRRPREWPAVDPAAATVLLHLLLAAVLLVQLGKEGGSFNYFLDVFSVGCVLVGAMLASVRLALAPAAVVLLAGVANLPAHQFGPGFFEDRAAALEPVVARIAAAPQPVGSDDLMLLIRAGKPVLYEPAIVGLMAAAGTWDAAPLTAMVRRHDLAFFVVESPSQLLEDGSLAAAIREDYPRVEPAAPGLWYRLPRS